MIVVSLSGGCLAVSHCPTNVGLRLLPFTGWRHLTLCISCPAQDKALCDSPTPPHFMGGQLHGQTGLVCAPRGEANLLGWTRSHQAGEARKTFFVSEAASLSSLPVVPQTHIGPLAKHIPVHKHQKDISASLSPQSYQNIHQSVFPVEFFSQTVLILLLFAFWIHF